MSKVNVDFNSVGDGDRGDVLHLGGGALEVDVPFVDGHLPVVPGLGALTTGGSSAADAEVFIGESDGTSDLDRVVLGIANQTICDLLDCIELVRAECNSCSFDLFVNDTVFLVFVCHHKLIN